jgi:hypothetical protein
MEKHIVIISFSFLLSYACFAQGFVPNAAYLKQTSIALEHYRNSDYKAAALNYDTAFALTGGKALGRDRFYAAFSWAMAGDKEKAIIYLDKAVREENYADEVQFTRETEFMKIQDDPRWEPLLALVKQNKAELEKRSDKVLTAQLENLYESDQVDRVKADSIQKKFGWDSKEMKEQMKIIKQKDSLNLAAVKNILDKRGWPGVDVVGEKGNATLFLVIQHADSASQEKYLPVLRKAVSEGNAKPSELALLEDRTRTNRGEKQVYGSQLKLNPATKKMEFYPIKDEAHVNERRAAMGLEPIEEYAKRFGIEYSFPKRL